MVRGEGHRGPARFKDDPSLSDEELAKIQAWVDNGAPQGNPSDMPPPLEFPNHVGWQLGEPDLVVSSPVVTLPAIGPDRWTNFGLVPTGATENRYVRSVEVREINDVDTESASGTVGGRYVFHHMTYSSVVVAQDGAAPVDLLAEGSTFWPVHEVGRNADVFSDGSGRLLRANSSLSLRAAHLHSNGVETTGHLEFGFRYFPKGYEPEFRAGIVGIGNTTDVDVMPNKAGQEFHHSVVLTEGEFKRSSQHLRKEEELRWRQASADGRIELCVRRWVHPVVPRWGAGSIGRGFGKKLLEGCRARSRRWQPACLPLLERAGFANVVACHLSVFVLCRGATYRSSSEKRLRFFKPAVVAYVRSPGSCAAHRRRSRENCGGTQQREVETSSIEPRPPNGMPIGERSVRKLPNSLRTAN